MSVVVMMVVIMMVVMVVSTLFPLLMRHFTGSAARGVGFRFGLVGFLRRGLGGGYRLAGLHLRGIGRALSMLDRFLGGAAAEQKRRPKRQNKSTSTDNGLHDFSLSVDGPGWRTHVVG
jgi:hypothetical protein